MRKEEVLTEQTKESQVVSVIPGDAAKHALSSSDIIDTLRQNDIIVTEPLAYDSVMNLKEAFLDACYWKDTRELWRVIEEDFPDYLPSMNAVFSQNYDYGCNVFIARREFVSGYCAWLFEVLGRLEGRISLEGYDTQHKRIYGYMAEHLLNVYIHRHNMKIALMRRIWVLSES